MTKHDLEQDLVHLDRTIAIIKQYNPALLRAHADDLVRAADVLNELAYQVSKRSAA